MCDAYRRSFLGLDDTVAYIRSRMVAFSKCDRQLWLDRQRPLSLAFAVPTGMGGVRVYLARRRRPLSLIAVGQRPISATRLILDQKPIASCDLTQARRQKSSRRNPPVTSTVQASTLAIMNDACKSSYHEWCAPKLAIQHQLTIWRGKTHNQRFAIKKNPKHYTH